MSVRDFVEPLLPHLAACVTFFYVPERLRYLSTVVSNYGGLAEKTDLYIITNVEDPASRQEIMAALPELPAEMTLHFVTPTRMGHPFLLTWVHRDVFLQVVAAEQATHFLYSEDDLALTRNNVAYWLRAREKLRQHGFIPAFFRVEQHPDRGWFSTDCKSPVPFFSQPKLILGGETYLCLPNPYQGLYLLDRELMEEFAASPAFSPDFGRDGIREKAAQGLIYANVPKGFSSRNLLLVDAEGCSVPEECWVHHLPNTYLDDPRSCFGKVPMGSVLQNSRVTYFWQRLKQRLAKGARRLFLAR